MMYHDKQSIHTCGFIQFFFLIGFLLIFLFPTCSQAEDDLTTPWQLKYADHFTDDIIVTENSYSSPNISITISKHQEVIEGSNQVWYVADIYISRIDNFQTYAMDGDFCRTTAYNVEELADAAEALISINGDYCCAQRNNSFFVRNGYLYDTEKGPYDICVLYYDGTMETYTSDEYDVQDVISRKPYQVWKFGPKLLEDGNVLKDYNVSFAISHSNPRSAIGYYEPGHYCFVTVDGRQNEWSRGLQISQLAQIFSDLGCKTAYNLDGGASATMTFYGNIVNKPSKDRYIGDILLIKEVPTGEE